MEEKTKIPFNINLQFSLEGLNILKYDFDDLDQRFVILKGKEGKRYESDFFSSGSIPFISIPYNLLKYQ